MVTTCAIMDPNPAPTASEGEKRPPGIPLNDDAIVAANLNMPYHQGVESAVDEAGTRFTIAVAGSVTCRRNAENGDDNAAKSRKQDWLSPELTDETRGPSVAVMTCEAEKFA